MKVKEGKYILGRRSLGRKLALALVATGLALALRMALQPMLLAQAPYATFFLAVVFSAWYGGLIPAVVSLVLGGFVAQWFFVKASGLDNGAVTFVGLFIYLFVGLSTALLSEALHRARKRAEDAVGALEHDVAERRRTEEALRRSERELNDFFENSTLGLLWLSPEGIILRANGAQLEMLSYLREEFIGRHFADICTDRAGVEQMLSQFAGGQSVPAFETKMRRKDGSMLCGLISGSGYLEDGKLLHSRCFVRNVTPRRMAEAALRESEERWRAMAETVPEILFTARPDGWNDYISPRFYEFTGVEMGHAEGFGWMQSVHPDDLAPTSRIWAAAKEEGKSFEVEHRFRGADGHYRWFLVRARPIRDLDGQVTRWFGSCTDIDVHKRNEAELQRAKASLEDASRAKDQFMAALSHELRTPLTPVLMTVTAMEQDSSIPQEIREDLAMVRRNVELETKLIDDLLDLTRVTRGKLALHCEQVDLHQLLRHAIDTCCRSDLHQKQLELVLNLDADEHMAYADSARVEQVLWNVLKNAVKFTPEHGRVEVRTSNRSQGWINIEVIDNGAGIEPANLSRIFNAFEQEDLNVSRTFGGLGLGLAISKAVVDLHGGTIEAQSEGKEKGSTFTISFPAYIAPARAHATTDHTRGTNQARSAMDISTQRSLRILLVEDHDSTAKVMARLLQVMKHEVSVAGTVESALRLASENQYDLIVSDLGLPDGNGHDLMRQLKETYNARGICLSGYGMEEDIRKSIESGFAEHLTKPLNFDLFKAAVERVGILRDTIDTQAEQS